MTDDLRSYHAAARDLGPGIGIVPADGETTERRILTNQPDDENARCKVSRALVQHKDFSPFTQQPTTRSTFNAISFQQGRTELFEARPWTHGVRPLLQHKQNRQRDHSRLSFDNVTKPLKAHKHLEALRAALVQRNAKAASAAYLFKPPRPHAFVTQRPLRAFQQRTGHPPVFHSRQIVRTFRERYRRDPGARFQVRTGKRKFGGAAAPRARAGDPQGGARPRASRYGDEPRQSRQPLDRRSLDPVRFAHVRRESARTWQRTSRTSEPRRGPTWRERAIPSSYRACSTCSRNRM